VVDPTTRPDEPSETIVPEIVIAEPPIVTVWPSTNAEDPPGATVTLSPFMIAMAEGGDPLAAPVPSPASVRVLLAPLPINIPGVTAGDVRDDTTRSHRLVERVLVANRLEGTDIREPEGKLNAPSKADDAGGIVEEPGSKAVLGELGPTPGTELDSG
jgi:hypothetical protein